MEQDFWIITVLDQKAFKSNRKCLTFLNFKFSLGNGIWVRLTLTEFDAGPFLMNGWRVGTLSNNGASSNYERKCSLTEAADDELCGRE